MCDGTYTIIIVGLGGIGSWLIEPIVRMNLTLEFDMPVSYILIDGDKYEQSNMGRQICHPTFIDVNKAKATALRMKSYFGDGNVYFVPEFLSESMCSQIRAEGPFCSFVCVDNNHARRICSRMARYNIFPGNEYTDGNCFLEVPEGPCIHEIHPEVDTSDDEDRSEMSCEQLSTMEGGHQIIPTNFMAAAHSLQMYFHVANKLLEGKDVKVNETYFDIARCTQSSVTTDGGRR